MKRGRGGENFSDEVESFCIPGGKSGGGDRDGASVEVAKRPRGRPPGSKNKMKPPVVITRDAGRPMSALFPHVLEIPAGHDVAGALASFARNRGHGVCVFAGSGAVAAATLHHPSPSPANSALTFSGRFDLLSISATFLPAAGGGGGGGGGMSVSMAGPQGQILGGMVAGPVVAAGTVVVVAASFANPTFHRLPEDDEASGSASLSSGGGGVGGGDEKSERSRVEEQDEVLRRPLHGIHNSPAVIGTSPAVFSGGRFASVDDIWSSASRPPY
ncbi:Putative DNA-binding protein ESCAROLA [Apostasia shenzhenica]|uniref:AT-hook motif nuclear-localized protein n=1 Tax=Apostasia shenzhenica TaxID=1088818 RepID=A0A2I0AVG2_9ASPA|nr:Putative DNA-binding protein ESCAROLA [Apostasia shenzhenica]